MEFFVLQIGGVSQYRYAWFEAAGEPNYGSAPECPACHRAVGMLTWLPPHIVELKQTKRVGDFLAGFGGCPFLSQERVVERWRAHRLTGMDCLYPITVSRMGTTRMSNDSPRPSLYGVDVPRTLTRVEHDRMNVDWTQPPDADHCRTCGPGGGGNGGIIRGWQRVVVDEQSWSGDDVFFAINFPGTILLSDRAADVIRSEGWSNVTAIATHDYAYSFSA